MESPNQTEARIAAEIGYAKMSERDQQDKPNNDGISVAHFDKLRDSQKEMMQGDGNDRRTMILSASRGAGKTTQAAAMHPGIVTADDLMKMANRSLDDIGQTHAAKIAATCDKEQPFDFTKVGSRADRRTPHGTREVAAAYLRHLRTEAVTLRAVIKAMTLQLGAKDATDNKPK